LPILSGCGVFILSDPPMCGFRVVFVLARIVGGDNNAIPPLRKGLFAQKLVLVQTFSAYTPRRK
jgi:hypothetical protein